MLPEIKFDNESSTVMNELLQQDELLNHDKVIVAVRFNKTGALTAFWVTYIDTVAAPFFGFTRDPKRAHKFASNTTPVLWDEVVDLLSECWNDYTLEDFKIVRIGERK